MPTDVASLVESAKSGLELIALTEEGRAQAELLRESNPQSMSEDAYTEPVDCNSGCEGDCYGGCVNSTGVQEIVSRA
jgi:hypothetical protein